MSVSDIRLDARTALWTVALDLDLHHAETGWTSQDLLAAAGEGTRRSDVVAALGDWTQSGYVAVVRNVRARRYFRVARRDGTLPPVSDSGGRQTEASPERRLWTAMRQLPQFTARDLVDHSGLGAPIGLREAMTYCSMLATAGYLRVIKRGNTKGRLAVYRLIRNTGPLPPREKRVRAVWDDNESGITYVAGGRS